MQSPKPKYRIYATLLDSYWNYRQSAEVWEKYWGGSDNPPHTPEEFERQQLQELIDRINRKPFDSEAADRGTAFNELVDALIEHRQPQAGVEVQRCDNLTDYIVSFRGRTFRFPISTCVNMAIYYQGALTQQRVEAILPTAYGPVQVYGLIDELMPLTVHDIKTTGSYSVGKFRHHHQHLVYPYALMKNGADIREFHYDILEIDRRGQIAGYHNEVYLFRPERDIPMLRDHCEEFIRFLEAHRDEITDRKVFGED